MHYLEHLGRDNQLQRLLKDHGPFTLNRRKDIHYYLTTSIMSQQLSTKVADTIRLRFLALYGGNIPSPEQILETPMETLRSIGLSNAKAGYVQNVARFALEKGMDDEVLFKMDNEEIVGYLTQIKGVGRWTVEMLLMFSLGREDIFAIDDWGVQNAMIHLYGLDRSDKKAFRAELLRISEQWSPYRTYACMYLWRWKDNTPAGEIKKAAPATKAAPAKGKAGPTKKRALVKGKATSAKKKAASGKKVAPVKKGTTAKSRTVSAAKTAPAKKAASKKSAPAKKQTKASAAAKSVKAKGVQKKPARKAKPTRKG